MIAYSLASASILAAVASRKTKASIEDTAQRMVLSPIALLARAGAAKPDSIGITVSVGQGSLVSVGALIFLRGDA